MIELRNIWFSYVNGIYVLKEINISFDKGISVIIGPNGSGKTTLLKIASCLHKPVKGKVIVDSVDYWSLEEQEMIKYRRRIVYVHEKPILLRGKVIDNIVYSLLIRGYGKVEAKEKAYRVAKQLGIAHLVNKKVQELSIGEKQLVALARALVLKPDYLLLDEPLAHLHLSIRKRIIEVIKDMKNKAIIIATHDPFLTLAVATKVIVLDEGRIVQVGEPEKIVKEYIL